MCALLSLCGKDDATTRKHTALRCWPTWFFSLLRAFKYVSHMRMYILIARWHATSLSAQQLRQQTSFRWWSLGAHHYLWLWVASFSDFSGSSLTLVPAYAFACCLLLSLPICRICCMPIRAFVASPFVSRFLPVTQPMRAYRFCDNDCIIDFYFADIIAFRFFPTSRLTTTTSSFWYVVCVRMCVDLTFDFICLYCCLAFWIRQFETPLYFRQLDNHWY